MRALRGALAGAALTALLASTLVLVAQLLTRRSRWRRARGTHRQATTWPAVPPRPER